MSEFKSIFVLVELLTGHDVSRAVDEESLIKVCDNWFSKVLKDPQTTVMRSLYGINIDVPTVGDSCCELKISGADVLKVEEVALHKLKNSIEDTDLHSVLICEIVNNLNLSYSPLYLLKEIGLLKYKVRCLESKLWFAENVK